MSTLALHDQGLGIAAYDIPLIFEQFRRGSNAVNRIRGTGLGLTSARFIVEAHGGSIGVESEEGRGSTLTIRIPLSTRGTQHALSTEQG